MTLVFDRTPKYCRRKKHTLCQKEESALSQVDSVALTLLLLFTVTGTRLLFVPFTPDNTKSKIDKFSKITNWVLTKQHHGKVLLNSFTMTGHTLGFRP